MWSPELGMQVVIQMGGSRGQIISVCTYLYSATLYLVQYLDNNGNPQSAWFNAEQLGPVI